MKNHRTYIGKLFLILIPIVFFSCETLVTDVPPKNLPTLQPKLVLTGYISPQDTLVTIALTQSSPLFSEISATSQNAGNVIENALVKLSNGQSTVTLSYQPTLRRYTFRPSPSTLLIEEGKTYTITAEANSQRIRASCTVPKSNLEITEIKVDTMSVGTAFSINNKVDVQLAWKIKPTQENVYFRLNGDVKADVPQKVNQPNSTAFERRIMYLTINFSSNSVMKATEGQTNFTVKGEANVTKGNWWLNGQIQSPDKPTELKEVYVEVAVISEPYYLFVKSVNSHQRNSPFSEPTLVYTNVEGGLGCFAASNKAKVKYQFKSATK